MPLGGKRRSAAARALPHEGMSFLRFLPILRVAGAIAAGVVSVQAWRLRRAIRLGRAQAQAARAFAVVARDAAAARVLVLGDSTGVGVGAGAPARSLAGLLAQAHPHATVVNIARSGARIADVPAQLRALPAPSRPFDLALLHAGGNDVLHRAGDAELGAQVAVATRALKRVALEVVWLGPADVGLAPAFVPPLSWWLGVRSRRIARVIGTVAARERVRFVDFSGPRHGTRFARRPLRWFSPDGLHPSAASYRYCWRVLRRGGAIGRLLDRA